MLINKSILLISTLLISSVVSAATLYKWVDAEGNITYQDSPPPDESQVLEQRELADSGIDERDQHNQRLIRTKPIDLFTTENCEACDLARFNLNQLGLPFNEQNLFENKAAQDQLKERSGGLNAPTLYVGDQLITSYGLSSMKAASIVGGFRPLDSDQAPSTPNTNE